MKLEKKKKSMRTCSVDEAMKKQRLLVGGRDANWYNSSEANLIIPNHTTYALTLDSEVKF